jgi:uncharacterized protein (DUF2147 family)
MRWFVAGFGLMLAAGGSQVAQGADALGATFGTWARGDGIARVRIAPCGEAVCATNVWVNDPSGDEKVGDKLILKVRPAGANAVTGTAFDPKRNINLSFEMQVEPQRMTTKGCVLGGFLCKSVAWTKLGS